MKLTLLVSLGMLLNGLAAAAGEDTLPKPCSSPEAGQFDFWVGEWNLSWTSKEGKAASGTNRVSRILDGCVIKEEFCDKEGGFSGMSLTTFVPGANPWKQTWVDNNGSYLDFTGEFKNNRMILGRKARRDGKEFLQRMQWYNIASNSFDWNWERSDDNGTTWTVVWKIHYERKS